MDSDLMHGLLITSPVRCRRYTTHSMRLRLCVAVLFRHCWKTVVVGVVLHLESADNQSREFGWFIDFFHLGHSSDIIDWCFRRSTVSRFKCWLGHHRWVSCCSRLWRGVLEPIRWAVLVLLVLLVGLVQHSPESHKWNRFSYPICRYWTVCSICSAILCSSSPVAFRSWLGFVECWRHRRPPSVRA